MIDGSTPDSSHSAEAIDLADAYAVKTPEDSRRLYRQWAKTYNKTFIEANSYIYPRAIAELFGTHVPKSPALKIVDVGCGTGALELTTVQPEGGKLMTAADYLRGRKPERFQVIEDHNAVLPLPL